MAEFRCSVADYRAAVQEKDTAHVKRPAHGAKRNVELENRTVVPEFLPRQTRRDRVSQRGSKTSADHAVAELSRPDSEEAAFSNSEA